MQLENMPWMRLTSHQNTLSLMWCIATLQIWVGIRSISSAHACYPAYMCGPSCLLLATHRLGSPQDTCGPSGLLHMAYCPPGLPVRTPSSCQDPIFMVGLVIIPGLRAWWCTIRDTGPIWEVGTTQASLAETLPCSAAFEWHMDWSSLHTIV